MTALHDGLSIDNGNRPVPSVRENYIGAFETRYALGSAFITAWRISSLNCLIGAVIAEDGPAAFALADRAVESGHDLKLVCRELSRVVRDLMVLSIDPDRAAQGELADDELDRLREAGKHFSREDLMRAFDLLAKAEQEIRMPRSRAITSRWCSSNGCTCGSWCRSVS